MYDPQEIEEKTLEFWDENEIFEKRRKKNEGNEKWSFIDGPITANFNMGIHHAAGRSYKDLYIRWKAMQGYDQRYQNGFDTQGLPVERQAEKELGLNSKKEIEEMGVEKFAEKCKEIVRKYSQSQTNDSIRLGQWMDWENSYYTYKDDYIEHVWSFTKKCHEKGLLEEGTRVLPWCPRCGTSLSQKEVSEGFTELTHTSVFIKLPLVEEDAYLMVWTTTPWTLSANVACAVNPKEVYAKVKQDGEEYYMVKQAVPRTMKGEYEIVKEIRGEELIGKHYKAPHPDLNAQKEPEHKVVPWEEVATAEGTGIVHIAPGCGVEDEELGKELELASLSPLDESGTYKEGYGWLTGKNVKGIAKEVISNLKERKVLYKAEDYTHQYPLCWRCDSELVWRKAKGEWFIDQTKIKEELRREAGKVEWKPDFLEKEYYDWLNNMEKWSVSRKRYWGTPLPIWRCGECGNTEVIGTKKELEEKAVEGTDQLKELHRPWIDKVKLKCSECGKKMDRITDVADCWMDSGLVPYATLNYLKDQDYFWNWFPADFVSEMREQVIKWFHTTMVTSVVMEEQTPYLKVMTYSEVVDDEGKPMSKSKGNAIWMEEAAEEIGIDNLRWAFIQGNPRTKTALGYDSGEEAEKELNTLFNIDNYITQSKKEGMAEELSNLKIEDRWILSKSNTLKKEVNGYLENLEPHKAAKEIKDFFLNDLSRGYIQLTRDRINEESEKKVVTRVMREVFLDTLKLMAPFTPFVTEEIYQESYRKGEGIESIHLFDWPEPKKKWTDRELEREMDIVENVNEAVLALRSKIGRGVRWPVKKITVATKNDEAKEAVKKLSRTIKEQTNVKEIEVKEEVSSVKKNVSLNNKAVGAEFQADAVKVMAEAKGKLDKMNEDIEEQGFARIDIGTKEVKLKRKHIIVEREMPEELVVREFNQGEVYLDKTMNEELESEGLARELMRHVQELRKEAGLVKQQDIELHIKTDEETKKDLNKHEKSIKERTGSKNIKITSKNPKEKYLAHKKVSITKKEIDIYFNLK